MTFRCRPGHRDALVRPFVAALWRGVGNRSYPRRYKGREGERDQERRDKLRILRRESGGHFIACHSKNDQVQYHRYRGPATSRLT